MGYAVLYILLTTGSLVGAEVPALPFAADVCDADLSPDAFVARNTGELSRVIEGALDAGLLRPLDLRQHYAAGTRGRKLREFISYITKQLHDDVTVHAVGRPFTAHERRYQNDLIRLRKTALAFGERHPTEHARLTTAWRLTVKSISDSLRPTK